MSQIVRVSHDGRSLVVRTSDSRYARLSVGSSNVSFFSSLAEARGGQKWKLPTAEQRQKLASAVELTTAAQIELGVTELAQSEKRRVYRVPKGVRAEARRGVRWAEKNGYDGPELTVARKLAKSESLGVEEIADIRDLRAHLRGTEERELGFKPGEDGYPSTQRIKHALLGGDGGGSWANKVIKSHQVSVVASAFEYDPEVTYFAGGPDPESTRVDQLYMLRPDGTWVVREDGAWVDLLDQPSDPQLIELDEESARTLAEHLDDSPDAPMMELQSINPIERNLFLLASASVDWDEVDRATEAAYLAGLVAAPDGIYTPQERSQNAQRQQRSTDGKFGGGAAAPASAKKQMQAFARARLSRPLPLVDDIQALIDTYLAEVKRVRGESATEFASDRPTEVVKVTPEQTDVRPLYVAIVDEVDTEAVLEVVALVPPAAGQQGDVTAWKRSNTQWVSAPDILADLRGATPPPVVELSDDDMAKAVLAQVDQSDADNQQPAPDTAPVEIQEPVMASVMWGEYGEIIPLWGDAGLIQLNAMAAAGVPGIADTPSDHANVARLKRYWTVGEGGIKIRWNTPGDMTRCMRQLRKYLGNRAPGYCALLHKQMTGVWPGDKKNIGRKG